jgi:hypothetical protein
VTTAEEYEAKAADMLVQLEHATSESERTQLRRARGVYLKLSRHGAEAAVRAAAGPGPRIKPEKPKSAADVMPRSFSFR